MPDERRKKAPNVVVYRLGATVPDRVRLLLDERRIKEQAFGQPDVVAVWKKAKDSARDALLAGLSVDSAIRLAYDGGHLAALTLLAVNGLKPSSGPGHHEMTFHAAAAIGGTPLDDLVADSEEIRALRRGSMYDPTIAGESEREQAIDWVSRTLPLIRRAVVAADPTLEPILAKM